MARLSRLDVLNTVIGQSWLRASVACARIGSKLIAKEWVAAGGFDALSARVAPVLARIQEARR